MNMLFNLLIGTLDLDPAWIPTRENYLTIKTAIQPSQKEDRWKEIGWRNQFWPAVQEARKLGRPILLWTMNGHPIGCT
jgi:hypothetical protein